MDRMVISFSVLEARNHLETYGFVHTLRDKRKRLGKDWYNYFRTDTKKGDVYVSFIEDFSLVEDLLEFYVITSGFNSLEEWLEKTKDSRHLYKVRLIEKRKSVPEMPFAEG